MSGKGIKMRVGVVAALLWVVTVAGAGWFFVKGWTTKGTDGRMEIRLAPSERDLILGEMRQLLKAVHGVVDGLAGQDQPADRQQMEQAARAAGCPVVLVRYGYNHGEPVDGVDADAHVDALTEVKAALAGTA